ncbi:MAG: aminotransferase class III-fold pyridoxal phosphate-dependent enzyme [Sulfobacillus thermotolerans]|nr:aminotransferase class III-fold pyridoxal phosphate-dependent enzyme [Sulfobacillus thermotolerans]
MRASSEEIVRESQRILGYIKADTLSEADRDLIVADSLENFPLYVTEAILKSRKSYSDDYSVAEWEDEGAVFRDTHGHEYIDCLGGYGVYLLGHRHPKVVEAVKSQLNRYALHSQELIDPLRGYLSKLVAMITPGDLQHSYLVNAGTEANEMALKLARLATGKKHFIAMEKGFHGKTMGSLSATGKGLFRQPYLPLVPGFQHVPFGDAGAAEQAIVQLLRSGETVAGIIVEPIQGEGGVNIPPPSYLPDLRAICDRYECLLIVDEIQTGMGRTGKLFGVDHSGVVPDIMTLGKAFGGGVAPIACMVAQHRWWGKMEDNPFILGSSTFGGNPLVASAAIAAIEVIMEEDVPRIAAEKGAYFLEGLQAIRERHPEILRDVRGRGLLMGMEFYNHETGYDVAKRLFRKNVLVGGTLSNSQVIRIEPPYSISYQQIDYVLNALEDALQEKV